MSFCPPGILIVYLRQILDNIGMVIKKYNFFKVKFCSQIIFTPMMMVSSNYCINIYQKLQRRISFCQKSTFRYCSRGGSFRVPCPPLFCTCSTPHRDHCVSVSCYIQPLWLCNELDCRWVRCLMLQMIFEIVCPLEMANLYYHELTSKRILWIILKLDKNPKESRKTLFNFL